MKKILTIVICILVVLVLLIAVPIFIKNIQKAHKRRRPQGHGKGLVF